MRGVAEYHSQTMMETVFRRAVSMTLFTPQGHLLPLYLFRQRLSERADPNEIWRTQHGNELVVRMPLLSAVSPTKVVDYLSLLVGHPHTTIGVADLQGRSALHLAAEQGNVPALEMLCAAGAPVDARDATGLTPLHNACTPVNAESMKILLAYGANPNTSDFFERTALHESVIAPYSWVGMVEKKVAGLLGAGCGVDGQDLEGNTALFLAACSGFHRVVGMLLEQGANPDIRNDVGERPLDGARRLLLSGSSQNLEAVSRVADLLTLHTRNRLSAVAYVQHDVLREPARRL